MKTATGNGFTPKTRQEQALTEDKMESGSVTAGSIGGDGQEISGDAVMASLLEHDQAERQFVGEVLERQAAQFEAKTDDLSGVLAEYLDPERTVVVSYAKALGRVAGLGKPAFLPLPRSGYAALPRPQLPARADFSGYYSSSSPALPALTSGNSSTEA